MFVYAGNKPNKNPIFLKVKREKKKHSCELAGQLASILPDYLTKYLVGKLIFWHKLYRKIASTS